MAAGGELRYDGRVAIVTGAGNGLGRAYALALAARGARVIVNDLGGASDGSGASVRAADTVVAEIKAAGGSAAPDYNSVEHGDKVVATAIAVYGRVDILVSNAGILRDSTFQKMTQEQWWVRRAARGGSPRVCAAARTCGSRFVVPQGYRAPCAPDGHVQAVSRGVAVHAGARVRVCATSSVRVCVCVCRCACVSARMLVLVRGRSCETCVSGCVRGRVPCVVLVRSSRGVHWVCDLYCTCLCVRVCVCDCVCVFVCVCGLCVLVCMRCAWHV
jgi:hypothetical protein